MLADRGYGKLKESIQHEISPYHDMSEDQLRERIAKLQKELGLLPAHVEAEDTPKPN